MLGVSTRAVDHMIADGRLVPTRLGWRTMISRKRLEAIAERGIVGNIRINQFLCILCKHILKSAAHKLGSFSCSLVCVVVVRRVTARHGSPAVQAEAANALPAHPSTG